MRSKTHEVANTNPVSAAISVDSSQPAEKTQLEGSTALQLHKSLEEMGFRNTFHIEHNRLLCSENSSSYSADQVRILGIYRFEGMSDPLDMSIIYALEMDDGTRGTIVDAFGPQASPEISEFLNKAHDQRETSDLSELPTDKKISIKAH